MDIAFSLDIATTVQLGLTVVLPILVGLVTTRVTSSGAKAWLLAGLTLLTSLLTELARAVSAGEVYDLGVALQLAVPAFAISVATHYGLWKPAGVSDAIADRARTASPEYEVGEVDDSLPPRDEDLDFDYGVDQT